MQSPLMTFSSVSSPTYWPSNLIDPWAHAALQSAAPSRGPSPSHFNILSSRFRFSSRPFSQGWREADVTDVPREPRLLVGSRGLTLPPLTPAPPARSWAEQPTDRGHSCRCAQRHQCRQPCRSVPACRPTCDRQITRHRYDSAASKLKHQAAVEIGPRRSPIRFTRPPPLRLAQGHRSAAAMLPPSTVVTSAVVLSASAWCRKAWATSSAVTSRPSRLPAM